MTAAWLLVTFALALSTDPRTAPARIAVLRARGRLAAVQARGSQMSRAGRSWRPGGRVIAATTVGGVALGVAVCCGVLLALAAASLAGLAARLGADVVQRRRARAQHDAVLAAVRVLTAELAAGSHAAQALAAAATAAPQVRVTFDRAAAAAGHGDPATVLTAAPRAGVHAVGVAWRLGQDTGSALGAVLERVADDLAAADAQRRAVTVALAGPRSSAVLVALLPVLGLGLGTAMGASPIDVLAGSPGGRLLCLAGVALDVGGVLWIRAVLRRAERP